MPATAACPLDCRIQGPRDGLQKTVILRYDDYGSHSSTALEYQLMEALKKRDLRCVWGIIPCEEKDFHNPRSTGGDWLPAEKIERMKAEIAAGRAIPALHGLHHRTWRERELGRSEFEGLGYHEQMQKLRTGLSFLQKALDGPVWGFIPPWNAYDVYTLDALFDLHFIWISAGPGPAVQYLQNYPYTCIPPTLAEDLMRPEDTVCLIHAYEFTRAGSFEAFESALDAI